MASAPEQGRNRQAATRQEQHPQQPPLTEPVVVFDGKHAVTVSHNAEKNRLEVHITTDDKLLHSLAVMPNNDLVMSVPYEKRPRRQPAKPVIRQEPLLAEEQNEHPPITLEGYPVRPASYNRQEHKYRLTLAHHPDPDKRDEIVEYYELIAEGAKADECYAVRVTETRSGIHVTGDDMTSTINKKNGSQEVKRVIRITSLEKFQGRPDNPEKLKGKVRLADTS